jgi:expansin (peptidoglycan-binding protein)
LPPSPAPPKDHDPVAGESIHFDLSDIAMARLQTGDPTGAMPDGVIPTKYKRIPCPVVGNMYFWLQPNGNEYYFSLTVVNMKGLGAAAKVEAQLPSGDWVLLKRNANYTMSRPQERYGTWATPQGTGPFALPITIRVTDGGGRAVVAPNAIKSWTPADSAMKETYYIDSGVQF